MTLTNQNSISNNSSTFTPLPQLQAPSLTLETITNRKRPQPLNLAKDEGDSEPDQLGSPLKKQKGSQSQSRQLPLRENQRTDDEANAEPCVRDSAVKQDRPSSIPSETQRIEFPDDPKQKPEFLSEKQKRSNSTDQSPSKIPPKDLERKSSGFSLPYKPSTSKFPATTFEAPYYAPIPTNLKLTTTRSFPRDKHVPLYFHQRNVRSPEPSPRMILNPILSPPIQPIPLQDPLPPPQSNFLSAGPSSPSPTPSNSRLPPLLIKEEQDVFTPAPPSPRPASGSVPLSSPQKTSARLKFTYSKTSKSIISVKRDDSHDDENDEDEKETINQDTDDTLSSSSSIPSLSDNESKHTEATFSEIDRQTIIHRNSNQSKIRASKGHDNGKGLDECNDDAILSPHPRTPETLLTENPIRPTLKRSKIVLYSKTLTPASRENTDQAKLATSNYDDDVAIYQELPVWEHIRNHGRCDNCRDQGGFLPFSFGYEAVNPSVRLRPIGRAATESPWEKLPKQEDKIIEGPLTRKILHLTKGSNKAFITTIEFTDVLGEDNLHAFIDRAEEDARKVGMPENLIPVKLIVTWDNGTQLNAIRHRTKNPDKNATVHLIRSSQGWRCAIRQMRKKWCWGNQNWTIWWMDKREEDNLDQRGILYDTSLSKPTHWCMPATWRETTTTKESSSVCGQPKMWADYRTYESVSAFYKQKMVMDWDTYKT